MASRDAGRVEGTSGYSVISAEPKSEEEASETRDLQAFSEDDATKGGVNEKSQAGRSNEKQTALGLEWPSSHSRMSTSSTEYHPTGFRSEISSSSFSRSAALDAIVREVAMHYKVPTCVVTLFGDDGLRFEAQWSPEYTFDLAMQDSSNDDLAFFRHDIARDLPIIVDDASLYENTREQVLVTGTPFVRFYAAAPLIDRPFNYIGTLSIIDQAPRPDFSLLDAAYLVEKAAEVADILRRDRSGGG